MSQKEEPTFVFTGFIPPVDDYFRMPNNWINISARIKSLSELKVVQYVLRHTWGYREYDGAPKTITTDEFMHGRKRKDGSRIDDGTGLSNRSVIDGLKDAIEHGYLICVIDATDKARIVKSYALNMAESDVKILHTEKTENRCEESSHQMCNIFTPDVKNVHSGGEDSSQRSEKDTIERHLRKTPKKNKENALSSIDETRTLSSSNSSSSITDEAIPSQAPSSEQREATQPLSNEDETVTPPTPKNGSQAQEKATGQGNEQSSDSKQAVSHSQSQGVQDASGKGNRGSRKPRKPTVSDDQRKRIDHVYDVFDALGCEVTEAESYRYQRTKSDDDLILNWFKCSPTEEMLGKIYRKLWNTPKDAKTGFDWKENMTIRAVLRQYDRLALGLKAAEQKEAKKTQGSNTKQVVETVAALAASAGYKNQIWDDDDDLEYLTPVSKKQGA